MQLSVANLVELPEITTGSDPILMVYNLRALQIFECVSRNSSIAAAATELNISPSAISHQLKKLGEQIGEKLIERSGRGMVLSASGRRLASSLTLAFSQIDESVGTCIGKEAETLRLAMCSTFGTGWLIKRLKTFRAQNPTLGVQLLMYGDDPVRVEAAADAFITIMPPRDGYWSLSLFDEELIAVSTKDFRRQDSPQDLTFITTRLDRTSFASDWREFLPLCNIDLELSRQKIVQCSHEIFALEAAKRGIGVALIPTFLAEADLEAGSIVKWADQSMPSGRSYSFCVKSSRRHMKSLENLSRWMYQEKHAMAAELRRAQALRA